MAPLSSTLPLTTAASTSLICELTGVLRDPQFHRCRLLLQELSVLHPQQFLPKLHGFTEREFLDFVHSHAATISAAQPSDRTRTTQRLTQRTAPFILVNQRVFLANEDEFIAFVINKTRLSRAEILIAGAFGASIAAQYNNTPVEADTPHVPAAVDAEQQLQEKAECAANEAVFRYRHISGNEFAYLLFEVDGLTLPRVEIELFHRVCPKTCANFVAFCQGAVPDVADDVRMLGFKGSMVHRIVKGAWIQAGDVTVTDDAQAGSAASCRGDGAARSLYGREFPDESFAIPHDQVGIVSMANNGSPHTNGSQFFITLAPLPSLNRKKVAFGRVVSGLTTLQQLARLDTSHTERPLVPCKIVDAGRIID